MHELVFTLAAAAAGPQQWRARAREAARRGKQVEVLEPTAYGGYKDVNEAWTVGVLTVGGWSAAAQGRELPEELQELWQERAAIMAADV